MRRFWIPCCCGASLRSDSCLNSVLKRGSAPGNTHFRAEEFPSQLSDLYLRGPMDEGHPRKLICMFPCQRIVPGPLGLLGSFTVPFLHSSSFLVPRILESRHFSGAPSVLPRRTKRFSMVQARCHG